ncbi:LacI family DNA-binding transcriptional regulator, partial [Yersinia sp. LJYL362]
MKNNKRITINDIAKLAGVSKSTTSLVLNGRSKEYRVSD